MNRSFKAPVAVKKRSNAVVSARNDRNPCDFASGFETAIKCLRNKIGLLTARPDEGKYQLGDEFRGLRDRSGLGFLFTSRSPPTWTEP